MVKNLILTENITFINMSEAKIFYMLKLFHSLIVSFLLTIELINANKRLALHCWEDEYSTGSSNSTPETNITKEAECMPLCISEAVFVHGSFSVYSVINSPHPLRNPWLSKWPTASAIFYSFMWKHDHTCLYC